MAGYYENNRPAPIVAIIGSMRYLNKMDELSEALTLSGYIPIYSRVSQVPVPGKNPTQDNIILEQDGDRLTKLSFTRIDRADFVLLIGPYIGQDTSREVDYCYQVHRTIYDITPFFSMLESGGRDIYNTPTNWWIDRESLQVFTRFENTPLLLLRPREEIDPTYLGAEFYDHPRSDIHYSIDKP